jgi:hypothetical protein
MQVATRHITKQNRQSHATSSSAKNNLPDKKIFCILDNLYKKKNICSMD